MRYMPVVLIALAGCAGTVESSVTDLSIKDGHMHVTVAAPKTMSPDDPDAELLRRGWLEQLARSNRLCVGRSVVETRTEASVSPSIAFVRYVVGCED